MCWNQILEALQQALGTGAMVAVSRQVGTVSCESESLINNIC